MIRIHSLTEPTTGPTTRPAGPAPHLRLRVLTPPPPRAGVTAHVVLGDPYPQTRPRPVAVAPLQGTLALDLEPDTAPRPVLRLLPGQRDELDRFARRFAQVVVEVVGGDRGVHQLLHCTTEEVYAELLQRATALQRTTPREERIRRLRAQVRSVRVFCPGPAAAELSIHVREGARSRAIAGRLEHRDGRWRCTVLQFG